MAGAVVGLIVQNRPARGDHPHRLGAAQNAALARSVEPGTERGDFLASISAGADPAEHPFLHDVAAQLRDHDDRDQFLAGINLILTGIAAYPR